MNGKILFLESFYGGSHQDFADGMVEHSDYQVNLITLPARFWKWRMRGAALSFYTAVPDPREYDCVFASDLMGLADLKALWGDRCPPLVLYFHENQLSYPVPEGERLDYHFGFTNITSALAADRVIFNSEFHRETFLGALPGFLRKIPEYKPMWVIDEIRAKCTCIFPGCRFGGGPETPPARNTERPLVVWNHRWEFDKDPDAFFRAIDTIDDRGIPFDLALLGENFQKVPKPFLAARERYGNRIKVYGYVEDRAAYYDWLAKGSVVVSTALQENYGISVIEAIRKGCFPLLPRRLSYPEILPSQFHEASLYDDEEELVEKLASALSGTIPISRPYLSEAMAQYSWDHLGPVYDQFLAEIVGQSGTP
jgi:glycosyltransferase involved in cell wall biosynthesis